MENLKLKTEDLTNHVHDLLESYYKLAVLTAAEKATNVLSGTLISVGGLVLGMFVIFFAGIACAWWLGNLVGNMAVGFLLVAAIFVLLFIVLFFMRRKIIFPIMRNYIIRKFYE